MENDQSSLMNSEGNLPRMGLPPFLSNHLLVFRMLESLRCRVAGRFGSLGLLVLLERTRVSRWHFWQIHMIDSAWLKIDEKSIAMDICFGNIVNQLILTKFKVLIGLLVRTVLGSYRPYISLGYTNPMAVRGHAKNQLTKTFMDGPFCVTNSMLPCY